VGPTIKGVAAPIELMVTVKGYPAPSAKHGESVCVAGVRTDTLPARWVRLWPVPFRDLDHDLRFKKYQIISVEADPPGGSDSRPETLRPKIETLSLGEEIDTRKRWARRRAVVDALEAESMCEIRRQQELDGTSLGMFRPNEVELQVEPDDEEWDPRKAAIVNQPSLFVPNRGALEKIPYRFKYRYRCADRGCRGHEQTIIDWEIAEAFRSWSRMYGSDSALERIRAKWVGEMCDPKKDTRFFVGNQHLHPEAFLVLGVFWPPKS
jgi:hypothetical protein